MVKEIEKTQQKEKKDKKDKKVKKDKKEKKEKKEVSESEQSEQMEVEVEAEKTKAVNPENLQVFVSGIPYEATEALIKEFFNQDDATLSSSITEIKLPKY